MESMKNETVVNTTTHSDEAVLDKCEDHELLESVVVAPVPKDMVVADGVSLPIAITREAQSAPAVVVEAQPVDGKKKSRPSKRPWQKQKLANSKKMELSSVLVGDTHACINNAIAESCDDDNFEPPALLTPSATPPENQSDTEWHPENCEDRLRDPSPSSGEDKGK